MMSSLVNMGFKNLMMCNKGLAKANFVLNYIFLHLKMEAIQMEAIQMEAIQKSIGMGFNPFKK